MIISKQCKTLILSIITVCALSMLTSPIDASAQSKKVLTKADSVCYFYKFLKGDSLLYRVVSQDSILFPPQDAVVKERVEIYMVICDSIGANGHYFISQTLVDFASKESAGKLRDQVRLESTWLNRKVWFEIDSLGNRYNYGATDTLKADVSPGGAFQPNLFFPIKESCKHFGESWIVNTIDDLPENCIPPPIRTQMSLFRSLKDLDTLGKQCNQLQYTLTGQGSVEIPYTTGQMLRTNSVIAQFGVLTILKEDKVPFHFFATAEIKLTVKLPNGKELNGKQFISSNFKLVEFHSSRFKKGIKPLKAVSGTPIESTPQKKKSKK